MNSKVFLVNITTYLSLNIIVNKQLEFEATAHTARNALRRTTCRLMLVLLQSKIYR